MSGTPDGPMDLFLAGEAELARLNEAAFTAGIRQGKREAELKLAQREAGSARNAVNEFGAPILEEIHESVTEDTDPGEYLQAVLNMHGVRQRAGDVVLETLAPYREQVRQAAIPIGIVDLRGFAFGLSAGDIRVIRKQDHEAGIGVRHGIALHLPLAEVNIVSNEAMFSDKPRWDYYGFWAEPVLWGIDQDLAKLRFAGSEKDVVDAFSTNHFGFNSMGRDNTYYAVKNATGTVPVVAYGESAVAELLRAISEGRNIANPKKIPDLDDVLAAGISLGIQPAEIVDIDEDELRERLHEKFLIGIEGMASWLLRSETDRRQHPNSFVSSPDWPITASPKILEFCEVERTEIAGAVREGIERSTEQLRNDHPADIPSWIIDKREYRLLEKEARLLQVELFVRRYGVVIDQDLLGSDKITDALAQQLAEKQKEMKRRDKFDQENPLLAISRKRT